MRVEIDYDEQRYPDYSVSKCDGEADYGQVVDIPDELYAEFKKIEKQYETIQQLMGAYMRQDNLMIIEQTAKLKGLV